jgi:hypothetical protein
MNWTHSRIMSVAADGDAVVVQVDDGWDALPFGTDGGSSGVFPSREHAIGIVEAVAGDMLCCVGHLAEDSDR